MAKQARKGFRPPSAMKGMEYFQNLRNFLEIFWIFLGILWEFFRRNFFGGIFREIFVRNFFGRIFWEDFWEDFLGGILWEEFN